MKSDITELQSRRGAVNSGGQSQRFPFLTIIDSIKSGHCGLGDHHSWILAGSSPSSEA